MMTVHLQGSAPVSIRLPQYDSGHDVTMTAGPEFAADLEDWLRSISLVP